MILEQNAKVAPLVGAWIERSQFLNDTTLTIVAPLVGAWIESLDVLATYKEQIVAPLVGAWIESLFLSSEDSVDYRRSSCRSVD